MHCFDGTLEMVTYPELPQLAWVVSPAFVGWTEEQNPTEMVAAHFVRARVLGLMLTMVVLTVVGASVARVMASMMAQVVVWEWTLLLNADNESNTNNTK